MNIDLYLFNLINRLSGKNALLDYFGIFCAEYLGYVLILLLSFLVIINLKKYWRTAIEALVAALLVRFVIVEIFYHFWFRARPFVELGFTPLLNISKDATAFPSGHASFYFTLSTIVYCNNKRFGVIFYLASIAIVISRVFSGVHWPSDILAGAVIGIILGLILNQVFRKHAYKVIRNYNK